MPKNENPRIKATELIAKTEGKVGVIIRYAGERFDVERARDNGYGAIEIFNYHGECHGLSADEDIEVLGYFNLA